MLALVALVCSPRVAYQSGASPSPLLRFSLLRAVPPVAAEDYVSTPGGAPERIAPLRSEPCYSSPASLVAFPSVSRRVVLVSATGVACVVASLPLIVAVRKVVWSVADSVSVRSLCVVLCLIR